LKNQAGASAKDGLRSIIISEQLLGTQEIVLVKHTGCGMLTFKNEDAYGIVEKNLGYVFLTHYFTRSNSPTLYFHFRISYF
jgi:carbonic anhydrase